MTSCRFACLLSLALLVSVPASAQVIHGHPQCTSYVADDVTTDPGVTCHLPSLISAQCHWDDIFGPLGHTHIELNRPPLWAVNNGPLTLSGQFVLFHVDGRLDASRFEGYYLRSLIWDATGTSTPPSLQGDPLGVVTIPFHVTFDPTMGYGGVIPLHGWYTPALMSLTRFSSGANMKSEFIWSLYSTLNLNAPEDTYDNLLSDRCSGNSLHEAQTAGLVYGTLASEYTHSFPPILAPISTPQTIVMHAYNYGGAPNTPLGTFHQQLDMNLHMGILGTTLAAETSSGGRLEGNTVVFDPAVIGPGAHKMAIVWDQQSGAGQTVFDAGEEITSLLVVPVTVGASVPPPTCTPPAMLQQGVCVVPPPPLPSWTLDGTVGTQSLWHQGDAVRICGTLCLVLGTETLVP